MSVDDPDPEYAPVIIRNNRLLALSSVRSVYMLYTESFWEGHEVGRGPAWFVRIKLRSINKNSESYKQLVCTVYIYYRLNCRFEIKINKYLC